MKRNGRLPVAVLGAGLIGVDLAEKIMRSEVLDCVMVVGRDEKTPWPTPSTRNASAGRA